MTVPVMKKGLGLQQIDDVRIYTEGRWRAKHLESVKSAYAHAPYFEEHLDFVEEMFSEKYDRLIDLNVSIIGYLWSHLGIETEMELLSELSIESTGAGRLVEICKKLGADRFLAQAPARKYLDATLFTAAGISLEFFQPRSPIYPQLWGDFIPNLSVFDLLFNCGPKAHDILFPKV